jgi:hypothetical protein
MGNKQSSKQKDNLVLHCKNAEIMNKKLALKCKMCPKILQDPIDLPCHCTVCKIHLKDKVNKNGNIECCCKQVFYAKGIEIIPNESVKAQLDAGVLTKEENEAKQSILGLVNEIQELRHQLTQEINIQEVVSYDHFQEIRRLIDQN